MVVGIVGGVILAVMRLSPNPVLSGVAWLFTWFFRSVPRYVLLTIMGALGILFQKGGLSLGVPFDWKIMELLGLHGDLRFLSLNANELFAGLFGAVLGPRALRGGVHGRDRPRRHPVGRPGQSEAAQAIGMNRGQAMRRVILPQAMRVIVPPTGNETIAMLKDTSLLIAIPLGAELFFQLTSIGSRTYRTFEVLVAAVIFYLLATSVLMVGQYYIERHFGRGFGQKKPKTRGSRARPGREAPDALHERHRHAREPCRWSTRST